MTISSEPTAGKFKLTIAKDKILAALLALAMSTSSVVLFEPAPVDALLAGFLITLIILGGGRLGTAGAAGLTAWLAISAGGLIASVFAADFATALKHQIITTFLALAAVGIGAFIAADPRPRASMLLKCYVLGAAIACGLAYIGYFNLLPGGYELFTKFGRARGGFKDPNVFGAAVAPAIVYLAWIVTRLPLRLSWAPALLCLFMTPAIVFSFSRGAWISLAVSLVVLIAIAATRTRREGDNKRLSLFMLLGITGVILVILAALQSPEISQLMQQRASLTQGYDEGPEGRFGGQMKGLLLLFNNPLGFGAYTFHARYHHEEVHNVYISMFHYTGWLGGLIYLASLLLTFAVAIRGALHMSALQGYFAIATAVLAGLIVEGLVIDSDHWRHFFIFLGLTWGLSDAAPEGATPAARRAHDQHGYIYRV